MTGSPQTTVLQISPTLEARLRERVEGEVLFDLGSRAAHAVDSSNYRELPIAVVTPRSIDDAVDVVATCADYGRRSSPAAVGPASAVRQPTPQWSSTGPSTATTSCRSTSRPRTPASWSRVWHSTS